MKTVIFSFFVIIAVVCSAATVQWNAFSSEQRGSTFEISCSFGPYFSADIDLGISAIGANRYSIQYLAASLAFCGNWLEGHPGEIINASSTRGLAPEQYIVHADIDDGQYIPGTNIQSRKGENFYLVFVCSNESSGLQDPSYIYGWVQLGVSQDGSLTLMSSAADLDGGPMIVGGGSATPEPSSGLLILLGGAVLALLRRRGARGKP